MYEMQFDFDGLIQVVAKNLYSEKKVFIRELVQNAHDGIRRRAADGGYGRIDIETRPQDLELVVRDNGIGMSRDDLVDYLSNVGRSLTRLERDGTDGLIGQFGIGFLSAFVVASNVQVRTRKVGEDTGWLWENDGSKEYRLTECEVPAVGTSVTVHLRDVEDRGLIQESEVRALIRKYADMLTVPIHLNGGADPENTMHLPWERAGLTPDELQWDLYRYLERTMSNRVLEAIPVRVTTPVQVDGVLYISRDRVIGVDQPRTVRVFQNRMFLCDNAADILPQWARFVNGVINTPDLTPTAARDNFIRDETAAQVRQVLGDVVIGHLEQLRSTDPERFADIARYHRLGFAAAAYYYDDFFERFADLLLWRTNRGSWHQEEEEGEPAAGNLEAHEPRPGEFVLPGEEVAGDLHPLPEILARLPVVPDEPVRLPCFTSVSAATQFFEIADAAGGLVVDASYPFEAELLQQYCRLPGKNIQLVHVDREDDPAVFRRLVDTDGDVRRLAEVMSQVLRTPFGGRIRVEARRFSPPDIAAVLRSDARSRAQQKAHEVRLDPNIADDLRQMAEELARMTASASRRLTINADNPLVRRLARQNLVDATVQELMLALYNDAILSNRELLTPTDAAIFHKQFQQLIGHSLDFFETRTDLRRMQEQLQGEDRRRRAATGQHTKHRIFFMMTPFADEYAPVVDACRRVVEEQWGCQLVVASDRQVDHRLLENVEALMGTAHAFIAEVSDANPNVMFELGAAFPDRHSRPFVLLQRTGASPTLPADLRSLIHVSYRIDDPGLDQHLATEIRKNVQLKALLDAPDRAQFLSPRRLAAVLGMSLPEVTIDRLANQFPTFEDWAVAEVAAVEAILGEDRDLAQPILRRVNRPRP